jgi:hypothetical protein
MSYSVRLVISVQKCKFHIRKKPENRETVAFSLILTEVMYEFCDVTMWLAFGDKKSSLIWREFRPNAVQYYWIQSRLMVFLC